MATSSILNFGQLTSQELLVYTALIEQGMTQAFLNAPVMNFSKISYVRNISEQIAGLAGAQGKVVPSDILFPIAPPTLRMREFVEDSTFNPLIRETVRMKIRYWQGGYKCRRQDFYADVQNTIRNVSEALVRPTLKLADQLVAEVLYNGKVLTDYTNTPFFSTTKPISPSGAISGTYSNLYTSSPLTSANVSAVINNMMSLVGEDDLPLNVMPDTLIVPPTLYSAAVQAVELRTNVFSNGNPFPGQANNTASFADNWIAHTGIIKQIVVLNELLDSGNASDRTTWYLAECQNPTRGGAWGLLLGQDPATEISILMDPRDYNVAFRDEFIWNAKKFMGASPGLPQLVARADA